MIKPIYLILSVIYLIIITSVLFVKQPSSSWQADDSFSKSQNPAPVIPQSLFYPDLKLKQTHNTKAKQSLESAAPAALIPSGNQLKVPILMYHYIGNNPHPDTDRQRDNLSVTSDNFEQQIKYLKESGFHTTTLDTLYAALKKTVTLPDKIVILTFDDGYIDFYYNAFPILQKYNMKATVFIPTGLMGQGPYLRWEQIKQMQNSGLISFEAHSVNHLHLPSLSQSALEYEIGESKKVLEAQLGVPVNFIAYPYGSSNGYVIEVVKKAGYAGALGTWPEKIQSEGTIFNMPRIRINQSVDLQTFIQNL